MCAFKIQGRTKMVKEKVVVIRNIFLLKMKGEPDCSDSFKYVSANTYLQLN